jgi:mRNA-degrading endonuclease toxin of MazEF toxin-antitoxin module
MNIFQRDIVEINFMFPNGKTKPHMAIVVSNDDLQKDEGFFYVVMISSKNYNPQYTFKLSDEMLTKPLLQQSYVICQLLGGYTEQHVIKKCGQVKNKSFLEIIEKIKESIF